MKKTKAFIIGRFQPLHNGHIKLIEHAVSSYDKTVLLIGSSFQAKSHINFLQYKDRSEIIKHTSPQVETIGIPDMHSNTQWRRFCLTAIRFLLGTTDNISFVTSNKDQGNLQYAHWFDNTFKVDVIEPLLYKNLPLHSSIIRHHMYNKDFASLKSLMPETSYEATANFINDQYFDKFKCDFENFNSTKNTVQSFIDSTKIIPNSVICCGCFLSPNKEILLLENGKGGYRLPYTQVHSHEHTNDAHLRLIHELGLVSQHSFGNKTYDMPYHGSISPIKIIYNTYLTSVSNTSTLTASHGKWIDMKQINPETIESPYYFIIKNIYDTLAYKGNFDNTSV